MQLCYASKLLQDGKNKFLIDKVTWCCIHALLLACRAGADAVTAVESVRHLAETATDIVALNGYDDRIKILHKDGRYLKVGKQDENADMTRQADLLVFEVRCARMDRFALSQPLRQQTLALGMLFVCIYCREGQA